MVEYWKKHLDTEGQTYYDSILSAIKSNSPRVQCVGYDYQKMFDAYKAILNDYPEYFYLSYEVNISRNRIPFGSSVLSLALNSIYSLNIIEECKNSINNAINLIKKQVAYLRSDEDKIIFIVEYIVRNTTYELNDLYNQNAAAALHYGKAQCSGIARALKLLLDNLCVDSLIIEGESCDQNGVYGPHSWNMVRLGNKYYHIDATSMLGCNSNKEDALVRSFLFYDDATISTNHRWDKTKFPTCTDSSKCIDDFNKYRYTQSGVRHQNIAQVPHYSSLYEFKVALKALIKENQSDMSFYLDINYDTPAAMTKSLQNAIVMALQSLKIAGTANLSVAEDLLINLHIDY